MKTTQFHVRLDQETVELVRKVADSSGLAYTAVIAMMIRSASAAVVRAAGVEWPHNVTRHTWASYHLAQFGSAARTAIQAGHTETVLFRHYRELVTPEAAREFWSIRPENLGPRMPQDASE